MKQLAILGGEPSFSRPLHVGRPNLPNRDTLHAYLDHIIDSRWLTNNGPLVRKLRDKLEEYLQVKHCIPVSNGTIALELAERALGFRNEVILPSYTFVATPHSLQWQKINPIFADIGELDVTISPDSILRAMNYTTSGIIGVHVYAHPCDYKSIEKIASDRKIKVLYDAAHAFGCEVDNVPYATLGDASVFSFHATKFFNSFEGGAIATNNEGLAEEVRLMANFGFAGKVQDQVDYLGINGKMTEISAAMGLAMLETVEQIRERNLLNFLVYRDCFSRIEGISLIEPPNRITKHNWQYVIARLDNENFGLCRDQVVSALEAENVLVRRYFFPGCHRMHPYREQFRNSSNMLPNTDLLAKQVIAFPTGQEVNEQAIRKIALLLENISEHSHQVEKVLKKGM